MEPVTRADAGYLAFGAGIGLVVGEGSGEGVGGGLAILEPAHLDQGGNRLVAFDDRVQDDHARQRREHPVQQRGLHILMLAGCGGMSLASKVRRFDETQDTVMHVSLGHWHWAKVTASVSLVQPASTGERKDTVSYPGLPGGPVLV